MSRRLTHEVGASRHPLLMTDPIARDVLWWMADAAQERNDCRIIMTVADLAESMDRATAAVRKAQERLEKAGLIGEVGRGDYNKRVKVLCINEDALNQRNRVITHEASARNDSGIPATNLPQSCPDAALISPQPCPDAALMLPQSRPDPALYARARFEREQEQELEQDQKEIATGPIEPNTLPKIETEPDPPDPPRGGKWVRPEEMPRDGLLVALAAKRRAKAAALAALPLPGIEAEPEAPPPPKVSPGEARVAAAVVVAMEAIGTAGVPERTLKLWRAKIDTRLRDDGVAEDKVSARLDAIRAAWGNLQRSAWHIENGRADRAHFFKVTLRSGQELDTMASKRAPGRPAPKPWAAVGSAQLLPPTPDPVADAEHAERMAALDRIEQEHLAELERQAIADARAAEAARPKPAPVAPLLPVKVPTETGRGKFARMSEALSLARG